MLTDTEVAAWVDRLGLTADAHRRVQEIRHAPPSRQVAGRVGNVTVRDPSRKMGWTIQGESVRGEWAAIIDLEYDPDVLEYYDQAGPIWLQYQTKSGKLGRPVLHTPDLFVLRRRSVGYEECKPHDKLRELATKRPHRYRQEPDGTWRSPPAEQAVSPLGFFYRIRCADDINWVANRNIVFLEDYLRPERLVVPQDVAATITSLVAATPAISLRQLLEQVRAHGLEADPVYALIVLHRIYVDLSVVALAEPERVLVFVDDTQAAMYRMVAETRAADKGHHRATATTPGTNLEWDGRTHGIANAGHSDLPLPTPEGDAAELPHQAFEALAATGRFGDVRAGSPDTTHAEAWKALLRASPLEQQEATRRYAIIQPYLAGETPDQSARTIRRWIRAWRLADRGQGCGLLGLLPRHKDRGFRGAKLSRDALALMDQCIADRYEHLTQRSIRAVYGDFLVACAARQEKDPQFIPPSYKAFRSRVRARAGPDQTRKRQGTRAAYQEEPFYWELAMTTPRHGDRPWEIVHIDHTELDVELVYEESGRPAGRCWLTMVTDAHTRRFLAVSVSYDRPSYRACLLVFRLLVQRWGRLPQTIVVDRGAEFNSIYFETFLAHYEITKKTRPTAHPRHGSVCERLFGTTTSQFIHNLRGNTQITTLVRRMTKAVDPKRLACWTLGTLYEYLCVYAYDVYDTLEHPALGRSPRDAYTVGMTLGGERRHRLIPDDEHFRLMTLPSTAKGTALVHPSHGVKINDVYYWHDVFRDPELAGKPIPVRFDPFDIGIAYVYVRQQWTRCHSEHYALLHGHSERERQLITRHLRERARSHGQTFHLTARRLAAFLTEVGGQEDILVQRVRDAEAKQMARVRQEDAPAGMRHSDAHMRQGSSHPTNPSGRLRTDVVRDGADEAGAADGVLVEIDDASVPTATERAAAERRRLKSYGSFL